MYSIEDKRTNVHTNIKLFQDKLIFRSVTTKSFATKQSQDNRDRANAKFHSTVGTLHIQILMIQTSV